jgi:hypothetical protein
MKSNGHNTSWHLFGQEAVPEGNTHEGFQVKLHSNNPENEPWGYAMCGPVTIGYVDHVNGPGGEVWEGYPPSRHELFLLARHWARTYIDHEVFYFLSEMYGSDWRRESLYAQARVKRIEAVAGEELVQRAIAEAVEEIRKQYGDRVWECFVKGDRDALGPALPPGPDES